MIHRGFTFHKNRVGFFIALGFLISYPMALAQATGQEIFTQRCNACHRIGGGRLVGPDLAGVNDRHPQSWILKFVKSPQAAINAGDPSAKALFEQFHMVMPDQPLTDDEIKGIMAYIKETGGSPAVTTSAPPSPVEEIVAAPEVLNHATPDEIALGQNLFQGKVRFTNGGPACNSCHNVKNDAVIGGGILAKELTTVFSRLGGDGVRAILGGPPFPVMQAAFKGKELTPEEIHALLGFLQYADKERFYQQPRDYGWGLFSAGATGVVMLLLFYWVMGLRRKKKSVNQDIYDRQIKSE